MRMLCTALSLAFLASIGAGDAGTCRLTHESRSLRVRGLGGVNYNDGGARFRNMSGIRAILASASGASLRVVNTDKSGPPHAHVALRIS